MKTQKNLLIDSLLISVEESSAQAVLFKTCDSETLNFKPSPKHWSILECIEHLNLYGEFYLPEIERRISQAAACSKPEFTSGFLGNYFVDAVSVNRGKNSRMKTPGNMDPNGSELNVITIDRFLKQQQKLSSLLEQSRSVSLSKTKTNISLMPLVKIRLGDTLRFLVSHIERHMVQAKALK